MEEEQFDEQRFILEKVWIKEFTCPGEPNRTELLSFILPKSRKDYEEHLKDR